MILFSDLHWPLSPCFFLQFFVTVLLGVIREKGIQIHKTLFPRGKEKVTLCWGYLILDEKSGTKESAI